MIPWTVACQAVFHCLQEFAQTHVHWVGDSIQPSHLLLPPSPLGRQLMSLSWCTSWGWSPDVQGCLGKRVLCPLDRHLRVYNEVYNFHISIHQKKKKWWEKASYSIIISNLIWCGYWAQASGEPSQVPVSTRPRYKDIYLHSGRPSLGILSLGLVFRQSRDWKQCLSSWAVGKSRQNLLSCIFSSGKKQNI